MYMQYIVYIYVWHIDNCRPEGGGRGGHQDFRFHRNLGAHDWARSKFQIRTVMKLRGDFAQSIW